MSPEVLLGVEQPAHRLRGSVKFHMWYKKQDGFRSRTYGTRFSRYDAWVFLKRSLSPRQLTTAPIRFRPLVGIFLLNRPLVGVGIFLLKDHGPQTRGMGTRKQGERGRWRVPQFLHVLAACHTATTLATRQECNRTKEFIPGGA